MRGPTVGIDSTPAGRVLRFFHSRLFRRYEIFRKPPMSSRFLSMLIVLLAVNWISGPGCGDEMLFSKAPFPVGVAINTAKLRDSEPYWTTALRHFNSFTPEKILKPDYLQPEQGKFNFSEADQLARFCSERNIRLHGHALIWHNALPAWLESFRGNAAEWDSLMKFHVQEVVSHFKGKIKGWDVVNEAFNDDGSLRKNIWLKNIGPGYIGKAYRYAREADPKALLFYNDYGIEYDGPKLEAVLAYFAKLKNDGVEIDGIGLQMHVGLTFPDYGQIKNAAAAIAAQGYLVHYSELDISLTGQMLKRNKKLMAAQRSRIQKIVADYLSLPRRAQYGITMWAVSDNDSWLGEEHFRSSPVLFDRDYRPKPAFCGFLEGLKN